MLALSLVLMDNESVLMGEKHFADATEPDDVAEKFSRKISYSPVPGRPALPATQHRYFQELVESRAEAIVGKWIDFFVLNKPVQSETIGRRIK